MRRDSFISSHFILMSRMTPVMWCRIALSSFRQLSVTRRSCCSCFISAFILSTCSVAYAEWHETNFLLYHITSLIYNRPLPYTNLFNKTDICSWTFHPQARVIYSSLYSRTDQNLWQSKKKLENQDRCKLAIKQDCLANVNTSQAPKISWYLWIFPYFFTFKSWRAISCISPSRRSA